MKMEWDYETIKEVAKENGMSVKDLLALSPGNDPFYVGSQGQMEKARWFNDIYTKMGRPMECHVRRAHYWFISQPDPRKPDGAPYENTTKDQNFLNLASKYARYAGLVPVENIIDRRNPNPIENIVTWDNETPTEIQESVDADSIIEDIVGHFLCWNKHNTQVYHIEIWCEKSTMNDILEPICRRYGINLVTSLGELSVTAVHQLIRRIGRIEKPVRIFYISDFDPAGECMPVSVARKIEYFVRLDDMEEHVKLKQIMLTAEQSQHYKLPRTPIKEKEKRKEGFEYRHGTGATELDALEALHKGEMARIIKEIILPYIDIDAWNEVNRKNDEIQAKVRDFLQDKVTNVLEELDVSEYDDYEPDTGEEIDDKRDNWLYDSNRDYEDQMENYKNWRKKSD